MDIKGLIFNKYSYRIIQILNKIYSSSLMKILCYLKGIYLGKNCLFYGRTHFYRYPGSKIHVGKNACFRSAIGSNHIGVNRPCKISTQSLSATISIGNHCGFSGVVIGAFKSIYIGNNVRVGANTLITDSDWHIDDFRSGENSEVVIEDNVWIGEGVKILKGVAIGKNTIIGAGSVVTKSIPSDVVAAGNPCKVLKSI